MSDDGSSSDDSSVLDQVGDTISNAEDAAGHLYNAAADEAANIYSGMEAQTDHAIATGGLNYNDPEGRREWHNAGYAHDEAASVYREEANSEWDAAMKDMGN